VLDSKFWLMIHVLMVVGSYGFFLTAGILAHLALIAGKDFSKNIRKFLYCGVSLLIPGTILGGVWAAQSWGRFWDWDPKESWAFVSSALFLIVIHLDRFKKIGSFGLNLGAIVGFQAITFTWYGVNYILGTGLHSYGFGNGGEMGYTLFVLGDFLFLFIAAAKKRLTTKSAMRY
jgi:ABC-type transport system involved in cytochrome c biogenesis permease subunit